SASGASFQNSSGYISFSIGEVITTTLTSSSAILTQGFHQTRLRTVPVINQSAIQMSVFPNPVKDLLILQIGDPLGFDYLLYDVRGGLLERGQVLDERTEINFSALAPAVYILRVTNHKEEVRLFQIVKY
ncbi:MAG: T9SS type A sorting domain-containing protein, partial [Bacteroidales bacterium]|nr:T9SS type A sorting domain-containing protein [Bacteroidales bacterium]